VIAYPADIFISVRADGSSPSAAAVICKILWIYQE
jgi:hypothetical protein